MFQEYSNTLWITEMLLPAQWTKHYKGYKTLVNYYYHLSILIYPFEKTQSLSLLWNSNQS